MESFGQFVVFFFIGVWALTRLYKKFDNKGEVKEAAKNGIVSIIMRRLK